MTARSVLRAWEWSALLPTLLCLCGAAAGQDCQQDVPCLLNAMTLDEKLQFFAGDLDAIDHVKGVSRLGIPDINMGDGPNGVANTIGGTATSFPCNMAAGDTFDKDLVRKYAAAMAMEFKAKGKNQILGPGANLARVPECGRTDEYISGDDPVLGAELVSAFVQGALEEHVMTTLKHLGNNEQETNRNTWNANPDAFVNMELYMKPFLAGVRAGAASLMCGYNKVGGVPACKNKAILQAAKKESKSFWIVSDWGAVYPDAADGGVADYINAGLDMEMGTHDDATCGGHLGPDVQATTYGGAGYCNKGDYMLVDKMKALLAQGKVTETRVDETVSRILLALKTAGLLDPKVQADFPQYTELDFHSKWFGPLAQKDVRTQHSRAVAHEVATKAMVLLQNTGSLLPLKATEKLEMYGCGDEMHFRAESGSAAGTEPNLPKVRCQPSDTTACPYPEDGVRAAGASVAKAVPLADARNGPTDPEAVAIICLTAASKNSEGTDRASLDLLGADIPWERFKKSVVYVVSPGAVLMPFAPKVGALLLSSLPGEMGGAAFADILLGKESPTGHLSITMPNTAHETLVQVNGNSDDYNEDLEVGYRWYQARNKFPNFAFGWGLSYAKYMQVLAAELVPPVAGCGSSASGAACGRPTLRLRLRRDVGDGPTAGVDQVVQLYVQHLRPQPRSFKELAGFGKLRDLQPGGEVSVEVEFDAPQTWRSGDGDKVSYDAGLEPVAEYALFLSLHGVEGAKMLFTVTVKAGNLSAVPVHDFFSQGPLSFDQDLVVWERAAARGLPAEKPSERQWGQVRESQPFAAVVSRSEWQGQLTPQATASQWRVALTTGLVLPAALTLATVALLATRAQRWRLPEASAVLRESEQETPLVEA